MRFVIDLDSLELIESATDRRRVAFVEGKRGDDAPFEVIFVRSGVAEELAASSVLTFGAREENKYDANAVVLDDTFAKSGSGTSAKYLASPSFNTAGLNALFAIDADDSNDPPYVDLMAEFSWAVGTGAPTSTKTFRYRVHNDVIRGDEVGPVEITGGTPVNFVAATGTLTLTANPTAGETVTIGAITYTFVAGSPGTNQVTIGGTASGSIDNLIYAVNMSGGNPGTTHGSGGTANASVTAAAGTGDTMDVTAITPGTTANSVATTETLANGSWGAATLAGGTGTPGRLGSMIVDSSYLYVVASVSADIPTWKKIALSAL